MAEKALYIGTLDKISGFLFLYLSHTSPPRMPDVNPNKERHNAFKDAN